MRVLLDECLPRKLRRDLPGHADFEVLVTIDGNLHYQQNPKGRSISLIVLSALDNTAETLQPLMPGVLSALTTIQPGETVRVAVRQGD